ncbi:MAG: chemotaxis protein CheA [Anaerolineae bacterium]|nr:chemotaxis protein CheA [Anaerolineae bacterium]
MELSQYLDLFISESQDHLQEMSRVLLLLEETPDDLSHLEVFFRAAHTLKGMSAALGFQPIALLAHDMEDVLDGLRRRDRNLTADLVDVLFQAIDALSDMLGQVAAGHPIQADTTALHEALHEAHAAPAALLPHAEASDVPHSGWKVEVTIAPDCALPGPRAFLVLKRLRAASPIQASDPPETALRSGGYAGQFNVFFAPDADPVALEKAALSVAEVVGVTVRHVAPPPDQAAQAPPASPAGEADSVLSAPAAPVVRIKVALLDQLLESVADMVINHSHMAQLAHRHAAPDLKEAVEFYANALGRLQETVLAMRMVPVSHVFNRFPRMVRDLAREQGKEIRFEMEGAEIELDRTILEKITDPLVHLLRNSIDHGIETPARRMEDGKPLPARIELYARRQQDKAVIEVHDDGKGLSAPEITRVAIARGIITAQDAEEMDERAIFELICRPGFSTRSEVTGVSGRGVGMEVVKQSMDEIGGTLEITSQPGQGSRFRLVFPLTMAILPALLVRLHREIYAIPLTHIVRTLDLPHAAVRRLHNQPVFEWEERLVPLVDLAEVLEVPPGDPAVQTGPGEDEDGLPIVMVEHGRQRYALIVDDIMGKEEIVLKPLEGVLQQIHGLTGTTIRGEGEIVIVLDVPGLARILAREGAG